ncbi:hypothetical protein TNCV_4828271 [Trichonephila clavipes]|uniref:Uncharacterized protein n=1 Tax=Trichonephila clavipes TaxID=2585209 RepID=A0A8X6SJ08_TRICX|nr:hypothetical protein TNCV_4828271 [Trichonephila clavipes]
MTKPHTTRDRKPHLVNENRDNSRLQEDDEPDEGSNEANAGFRALCVSSRSRKISRKKQKDLLAGLRLPELVI